MDVELLMEDASIRSLTTGATAKLEGRSRLAVPQTASRGRLSGRSQRDEGKQ